MFLVTSSATAILKREETSEERRGGSEELELGLIEAYRILWRILWSRKMLVWIIFQLTGIFCFSAAENIFKLKLVEESVPRENIAQLALPLIPVMIIVPLIVSR